MINIFITYRCNLHCPYCFAADRKALYRQDMTMEGFQRLLAWMAQAGVMMAGFIGGEPTLCPNLPEMIRQTKARGIAVTLFTNGLFPSGLIPMLTPYVDNFVVNYNDPAILSAKGHREWLHQTLSRLSGQGARITFSRNFSPRHHGFDDLIQGAERFGVRAIRYDISRPAGTGQNDYVAADDTPKLMRHLLSFVRTCEAKGINTGLDCCVRLCDMDAGDRDYLGRISMKFTGICHPAVDIHPDLSASYCQPLFHVRVPDVTRFSGKEDLVRHFAAAVRPLRREPAGDGCTRCRFFTTRCQGGCLATKTLESRRAKQPRETVQIEEIHV